MILFNIDTNKPTNLKEANQALGKDYIAYGCTSNGRAIAMTTDSWEVLPDHYIVLINPEVE